MVVSKNIDERLHYNTLLAKRRYADQRAKDFTFDNASDLGEVVKVEFQTPTGLKEEIRELADRTRAANGLRARSRRHHALGPEYDRLDELIIEAHERGWTSGEIGRALRCSTSSAANRVRNALEKRAEAVAA